MSEQDPPKESKKPVGEEKDSDGIGFMFAPGDDDAIDAFVSAWAKKYNMPES